eukprot:3328683-Rhodomonas_salina.2
MGLISEHHGSAWRSGWSGCILNGAKARKVWQKQHHDRWVLGHRWDQIKVKVIEDQRIVLGLRACSGCAKFGSKIVCRTSYAMRCPVLTRRIAMAIDLRACYAMSGTKLAYAATRASKTSKTSKTISTGW